MANDSNDISRREFVSQTAKTAAGVVVAGAALGAEAKAAPLAGPRARGANDRIVLAVVGIRGQGNSLKRGFAKLANVDIKTLCDPDANLFASRVNDRRLTTDVPSFKPGTQQDLRRVLEDKDIDGVLIATPNHWHALATIWALQAGKHVYVEKPASHTVWEGRQMVEAARKYDKLVQVGTMNRSRAPVREAIKFLHDGGIGEVFMARGLCFKPRPSIGRYPDGPVKGGTRYRLNVEASDEPSYDDAYLSQVDYDLWLGPAPKKAFNPNRFHYNWHWHWDFGNGDTGNQGPHQFDIARWGLNKNEHPVKIVSSGGLFANGDTSQETPNVHTTTFTYADGKVLEFATRGIYTNDEGTQRIGNLFYGAKGWVWIDGDGRSWQSYLGRKNEKGPGSAAPPEAPGGSDPLVLTSTDYPHYQNFIDAIRTGDRGKLTCEIEEGHLSSALPHLANIAYRVGHSLEFDPKLEKFVGDPEADALLTREYRAPFTVPEKV
jgi:predicted dehydrogenase